MAARMLLIGLALIGAGCSGAGSDEDASADSAEPTGEQLPTETELSTAVAPVATLPPAATSTSPASTTTIPTTSTTTTTAAPTTTIDPGDVNDFTALLLLGELRDGTNPELVESLVSDLEGSFILERVDLVSAHLTDDGLAELVIVGDSGYRTGDYQVQAAADAVVYFGGLWAEVEAFCCGNRVAPRLQLTIDGATYLLERDDLLAVNSRQMTPEQALGI